VNNAAPVDPENRTRHLMGVADIAALFNVTPNTVGAWISRAEHGELPPTPPADVEITTARPDGQTVRGWDPARESEWRSWKANLPGRGWRKGQTGERRYTTMQHIGRRPGRTHKEETP
jgi:transposase-like protein